MANWNLRCPECDDIQLNVVCSMMNLPNCPKCGVQYVLAPSTMSYLGTNVFPFTVPHVNGKPMTIESLSHLRKVEKDYGVVFSAFSKDNINDMDGIKSLPKFRGDEMERRR